jgi:predicted nucleic acid-binding protein
MADQIILLDTNVLIDYFRKSTKQKTILHTLVKDNRKLAISVITHFEILRGINEQQEQFWWELLKDIEVISYFPAVNYTALQIQRQLKAKRKSISIQDLLIAATAVHFQFPLATLNLKHFENIEELKIFNQ